ncbi:spore photoproduct lyase family protein [Spirosoma linguale]|uniref:Radical SAM domain-containing protein n=1 Tax=Spirosoma linguale (strain ATCC 33905 / DSM 74 / LMG 10896 / Claus 1) TaxID=504472 RepID=D2QJZ5_SPILD|nr:radical SAM domain-containing protein [Spirosoma linguale DSM 74]
MIPELTATPVQKSTPEPLTKSARLWMPKRVIFTADALNEPFGQAMYERISALDLPIEISKNNRITGLRGADERETYRNAKNTLAIVNAPPGAFKLQPIPPSADWQMNLAEGCPAHCQYCYLAGSLSGPPVVRAYANLPKMLAHTATYEGTYPPNRTWQGSTTGQDGANRPTTFEVSCYTDVLGIEHLTGSMAECIRYYGTREMAELRFVTKYDQVDSLLNLPHNGHTRARVSLNADAIARRLEGGTASVEARLQGIRKLAMSKELGGGGYPIGLVIAPIMPIPAWREHYTALLDRMAEVLDFAQGGEAVDMNVEFISHRFTPGSKDILLQWYPNTSLDMDEATRSEKRNKFGGTKYVYRPDEMREMKAFFYAEWTKRFPKAPILYWT